ncbi:unnamed protein product [[Candida] boidinii]|nr:unnamed protein product [[Candida] boidinii]
MKFGEDLNEHLVPEWRDQYFNYKKGKKELKKLKNKKSAILHLSSLTNTPVSKLKPQFLNNSNNLSNKINDGDFEPHSDNINNNNNIKDTNNNNNNVKDSLQSFILPSPAIEPEDTLQKNSYNNNSSDIETKAPHLKGTGITNFTETEIDPTDTTSNDAGNINEGTPLLTPNDTYIIPKQGSKSRSLSLRPTLLHSDSQTQDDSAIQFGGSNNNNNSSSDAPYTNSPFALYLNRRKSTFTKYLSRSNSISYSSSISPNQLYNNNSANKKATNNKKNDSSTTNGYNNNTELENLSDYARDQFIEWVDSELRKIESFYREKENSYLERFLILQDQVVRLKDQKLRSKLKAARMKRKLRETTNNSPETRSTK